MDPTNVNILYHSDLLSTRSLAHEPKTHKLIWWMLAIIEALLLTRLILVYFGANPTGILTHGIYMITSYIMYPFTTILAGAFGDAGYGLVTVAAITGYLLLTIALVGFLKTTRSPRSKIEHARALSRRKYSH